MRANNKRSAGNGVTGHIEERLADNRNKTIVFGRINVRACHIRNVYDALRDEREADFGFGI